MSNLETAMSQLEEAALEFMAAYKDRQEAKNNRAKERSENHRCLGLSISRREDLQTYVGGDESREGEWSPACPKVYPKGEELWCESCKEMTPHHQRFVKASRRRSIAISRLVRIASQLP